MVNECQEQLIEDDAQFLRTVPSNCGTVSLSLVGLNRQLPSFMLIKDMPNSIEGIFGTLINKMTVMDEVRLVLCLGPKDTGEGFINTYTCHLPAYVYRSS